MCIRDSGNGSQSSAGVTGGAINAVGGQGAEAGGQPGSGQQGAGGGGGRILPGVSSVGGSGTGGAGGQDGTNGGGGGRVTPGADYTPAAGGGGGWGQGGLDANGNEISSGGAAITGNTVTGTNDGEIRGDGAILQAGTFLSQAYTSSGTVSLTGTGPGWVFLTGGGGSGGAFIHVTTQPQAGPGGTGGLAGMFLDDLADA